MLLQQGAVCPLLARRYPGLAARGRLEVARLDELLQPKLMRQLAGKVGVVKIDVEGNEERVGIGRHARLGVVGPGWGHGWRNTAVGGILACAEGLPCPNCCEGCWRWRCAQGVAGCRC